MQEPATIEDVHDVLCSPQQRKSSQRITQSTPKRRSVKKRKGAQIENVDKRSKSEAVSIAEDIRTLWIEKKIDKSEIGLRLLRKTVGPDGKQYKKGIKVVKKLYNFWWKRPRWHLTALSVAGTMQHVRLLRCMATALKRSSLLK